MVIFWTLHPNIFLRQVFKSLYLLFIFDSEKLKVKKVESEKLKVTPQHAEIIQLGIADPENADTSYFNRL